MARWRARKALVPWLRMALLLTVLAALVEFILLRLLLRGGAFAPPGAILDQIFNLLLIVGLAALNFAFLAAGVALALVAFLLLQGGAVRRTVGLLIGALLVVGLLLALLPHPMTPLLYHGLLMALLVPLLVLFPRKQSWDFLAACAIAVALGTTYYFQASLSAGALGLSLPLASGVFSGGEVLTVAVPFLLLPGRRWKPTFVPLAAFPAAIYLLVSDSPFVSLVSVWTVYLTLFLPPAVYALAIGAATYSLADFLSEKPQRWMGVGFLLIALGGRMFQSTYLAQLSLLGFVLFVVPAAALGLASRGRTASLALPGSSGWKRNKPRMEA